MLPSIGPDYWVSYPRPIVIDMTGKPKFAYSLHARKQMVVRGITEAEVAAVVQAPEFMSAGRPTPGLPPTKVLRRTVGGRRLKVVVAETDPLKVITVASPDE